MRKEKGGIIKRVSTNNIYQFLFDTKQEQEQEKIARKKEHFVFMKKEEEYHFND